MLETIQIVYTDCLYRGHSNSEWELIPTLGRFYNRDEFQAASYHEILKSVLLEIKIKNSVEFSELNLPKESPFLNGLMYGNDEHKENFQCTFNLMIELRHLGFPSPIIDLTKNPDVAAFFALSNTSSNNVAIYCVKKISDNFAPFDNSVHISDFNFDETLHEHTDPSRHKRQSSSYMIAINQTHEDTCTPIEKKLGPSFLLSNIEETSFPEIEITKFIITDSKNNRLEFLQELEAKGLSHETIYGPTHILENSHLNDPAIKEILSSDKMNTIHYPWIECSNI
jgi:hypothetical protein